MTDPIPLTPHQQFILLFKESRRLHLSTSTIRQILDAGIDTKAYDADTFKASYPEYYL